MSHIAPKRVLWLEWAWDHLSRYPPRRGGCHQASTDDCNYPQLQWQATYNSHTISILSGAGKEWNLQQIVTKRSTKKYIGQNRPEELPIKLNSGAIFFCLRIHNRFETQYIKDTLISPSYSKYTTDKKLR